MFNVYCMKDRQYTAYVVHWNCTSCNAYIACTKIASNIETKVFYRAVTRGIYTKDVRSMMKVLNKYL